MDTQRLRARNLRNNPTPQEKILWSYLKNKNLNGLKFRRQYPIGKYIVDFVCIELKLIIELDGGQHNEDKNIIYHSERTKFLESNGYNVVRFWNNDIDNNIEGVYEKLLELVK